MNIEFKKIETAEEYIDLVEKLSYLVDRELTKLEKRIEKEGVFSVLGARPQLIPLVNTIAYLRGEDGVFFRIQT